MNNISTFGKQCKFREIYILIIKMYRQILELLRIYIFFKLSYFESIDYNILL